MTTVEDPTKGYTKQQIYSLADQQKKTFGQVCAELGISFPKTDGGQVAASPEFQAKYNIEPKPLGKVHVPTMNVEPSPFENDPPPTEHEEMSEYTPIPNSAQEKFFNSHGESEAPVFDIPTLDSDLGMAYMYSIGLGKTKFDPTLIFLIQLMRQISDNDENLANDMVNIGELLTVLQTQGVHNRNHWEKLALVLKAFKDQLDGIEKEIQTIKSNKAVCANSCQTKKTSKTRPKQRQNSGNNKGRGRS